MVSESCPYCSVGRLHNDVRTYMQVYGGTLVHIPNVPARHCDVCGYIFYDEQTLRRCELLIGDSGLPPNVTSARASASDAPGPAGESAESLRQRPE